MNYYSSFWDFLKGLISIVKSFINGTILGYFDFPIFGVFFSFVVLLPIFSIIINSIIFFRDR